MTRSSWLLLCASCIAVLALSLLSRPAQAFPKFAQKEKKPCSYCHVNPRGGGKRTEAGIWYGAHHNSFAGYKPKAAKSGGKPAGKPGKK